MAPGQTQTPHIDAFNFVAGRPVAGQYEIITRLGAGWEGEVYLIRERTTGIEKTAKFFFPQRNRKDRASRFYARKLHKLRHCPIVIQYYAQDTIICNGAAVTFLVSEFVEGELLSSFLQSCRTAGQELGRVHIVQRAYTCNCFYHTHACGDDQTCAHVARDY